MSGSWQSKMVERLKQAVNGEKDAIMAEYSQLTGKSVSTLYRVAKDHGFTSGRRRRADKGDLKSRLTEEQILYVMTLMQTSKREVKGVIMSVDTALDIAIDNGVIAAGQISSSRLQTILRERGMNAAALDAPAPCIRMASDHPNHVHVFDASVCIQYYLKGKKGMQIMDERDFYKNKPQNFAKIKTRLIRYLLVDHFSGFLFVKYYNIGGENQLTVHDFLTSAWRGGHHEKLPFHGVPFFVLMDAGAAHTAKGMQSFLQRLDIEMPKALPHNPRRQGAAEVAQNIVERQFESRLRFCPADTVEELNAWCIDWLVHFNSTKTLRRTGINRTACWLKIKQPELRLLPADDLLQDLFAEPEVTRTVRPDNTISFRSEEYRVKHIAGLRPGKKVTVALRPYHWPEVAILFDEVAYLVQPIGKLEGGFSADSARIGQEFKAQPETITQKAVKQAENLAYGEERKKNDIPFGGSVRVFGHHADKLGNLATLPKRGTPMQVDREAVPKEISITQFLKRLRSEAGRVEPETNRALKEHFGSSINVNQADQLIRAIAAGDDWRNAVATPQQQAL